MNKPILTELKSIMFKSLRNDIVNKDFLQKYFDLMELYYDIVVEGYTEKHHIIPKSFQVFIENSDIINSSLNLISLPYKQHIQAHYYLYKSFSGEPRFKMSYSLRLMINSKEIDFLDKSDHSKLEQILNEYDTIKQDFSKRHSIRMSNENNPMYGLCGELNPIHKHTFSEEEKLHRSELVSGENNPMYGRRGKYAPAYGRTGEKHPMYGTHNTQEEKEHKSQINKKYWEEHPEEKEKKRQLVSGKNNPRARKLYQFNQNGDLIMIWDCIKDAQSQGFYDTNIRQSINKGKPYKKCYWSYTPEPIIDKISVMKK